MGRFYNVVIFTLQLAFFYFGKINKQEPNVLFCVTIKTTLYPLNVLFGVPRLNTDRLNVLIWS